MAVGHAIGGAKGWRVVEETYRCHKLGFNHKVMLIACGLYNF